MPLTLVGRKQLPPADVTALIDWLKGQGAGATFGTAGVGAVSDLCGRLLIDATGIKPTVVPYKGTGPAMNDLVAGQIDFMCDQTTNTTNQIKSGGIKPYAATTRERIAVLPQVPTLNESGVKGFRPFGLARHLDSQGHARGDPPEACSLAAKGAYDPKGNRALRGARHCAGTGEAGNARCPR